MGAETLPSWNDTATRSQILEFVDTVTSGPDAVPVEERIAVFDNDGTLWPEKPMPVELVFILRRWTEMAEEADYLNGAETALDRARTDGWTVVSAKNDWSTVFAGLVSAACQRVRIPRLHLGAFLR